MENIGLINPVLVILAFYLSSGLSDLSINLELSTNYAYPGDSLIASCVVNSTEREIPEIRWFKKIDGGDYEIGPNSYVNDEFERTGRFSGQVQHDKHDISKVTFVLTILNLEASDSGLLGCSTPSKKVIAWRNISIFTPIQHMTLTSQYLNKSQAQSYFNNSIVAFESEEDIRLFSCHVTGGYPKPIVAIFLGKDDVTNEFTETVNLRWEGSTRGLRRPVYEVSWSKAAFSLPYERDGQQLSCEALVPKAGFPPVVMDIQLELRSFRPRFNCSPLVTTKLDEKNVSIQCEVHSKLAVHEFSVLWSDAEQDDNNQSIVTAGAECSSYYCAEARDVAEKSDRTLMILNIPRIDSQTFRKYYFAAKTDRGTEVFPVELREDVQPMTAAVVNSANGKLPFNLFKIASTLLPLSLGYTRWHIFK